jgi:hypothetical protein
VIDDLTAAEAHSTNMPPFAGCRRRTARRGAQCGLVVVALLLFALVVRPADAHETIDADKVNELVAASDKAVARAAAAATDDPGSKGEAQFALGMVLVEVTDTLNRDIAAHSGRLTVNGELLMKTVAQRNTAPRFDQTIGRYRQPKTSLEEALRLAPNAPYAPRARFALLRAGFYESFVLDPFTLVGIGFGELERQIAEAEALPPALLSADDAEEAAFIHAIDLARAARLASDAEVKRAYAGKAQKALMAFAEAYPDSMRAAAARLINENLGDAQ